MACNQEGNASIGKNVPQSKNCGRVIILAIGGIVLSLRAIPETTKPKPIKTSYPIAANKSSLTSVQPPSTNVNSNTSSYHNLTGNFVNMRAKIEDFAHGTVQYVKISY